MVSLLACFLMGSDSDSDLDWDGACCFCDQCLLAEAVVAWPVLPRMRADIEGGVACETARRPVRVVERL